MDVVLVRPHAAPFADLDSHAARNDVAAGEILISRRIAFHETLAFRVGQIPALAACAFGDEAARTIDAGGVKLDKLHILKRQARAGHHAASIAGAGMGRGRREIGAAIAAGRQNHGLGAEDMHGAVVKLPRDNALTNAIFRHDQVDGEILDEELGLFLERLAIERVQDRVAGAVGGGAGALHRRSFAKLGGVAAEGALINLAFLGAREGHAIVLKLVNRLRRLAGEVFHRIGIAEPVRALDGIVKVPLPAVGAHVAKRGGDAPLGGNRMRAGRKDLRDTGRSQPLLGHAKRRPKARATGANHDDIVFMGLKFVGSHSSIPHSAIRASANRPTAVTTYDREKTAMIAILRVVPRQ